MRKIYALGLAVLMAGFCAYAFAKAPVKKSPKGKPAQSGAPAAKAPARGTAFTDSLGMAFVYCPPGTFVMGSPESEPERGTDETRHTVTLTKGFYMQTTEVTQRQWKAVMENNPSYFHDCGENCPVDMVSWNDCQKFIGRLNSGDPGKGYRLPTEAEWEYACRAGSTTPFNKGICLSTDQANYNGNKPLTGCPTGNFRHTTTPVASFAPNAWGLYDMHGNVWEWCSDWLISSYYANSPNADPVGPGSGVNRVLRGGSFINLGRNCRSAYRSGNAPDSRGLNYGFRLVRSAG